MTRRGWIPWGLRATYIGVTGTSMFFFWTHLDVSAPWLSFVTGLLLVAALGLHELMQTARTNTITAQFFRSLKEKKDRGALAFHMLFNWSITLALFAFNAFALMAYITQKDTGHIPFSILELDTMQAYAIPLLGIVASVMVEIEDRASDVLHHTAQDVLMETAKKASKQWMRRLKSASKTGNSLAPIGVALMMDSGEVDSARLIGIIEDGLSRTERGEVVQMKDLYSSPGQKTSGSTARSLNQRNWTSEKTSPTGPNWTSGDGSDGQSNDGAKRTGRKPRSAVKKNEEQRVHSFLDRNPNASLTEIVKACNVSKGTAIKHRNSWLALHTLDTRTGTEG